MKITAVLFLIFSSFCFCQEHMMELPVSEAVSENGKYSFISYGYHDDYLTQKGKTYVYHNRKEIYTIDRNLDLRGGYSIISNDGKTITYITNATEYYTDGLQKNISIFRDGKLVKEFDELEFTGCNTDDFVYDSYSMNENPCNLFYFNRDIFAKEKTKEGSWLRKKDLEGNWVLREDLEEEELFLYKNYVFSHNDTVYVIDKRKIVTLYDLNKLE